MRKMREYIICLTENGSAIDTTSVDAETQKEAFDLAKTVFEESGHTVPAGALMVEDVLDYQSA